MKRFFLLFSVLMILASHLLSMNNQGKDEIVYFNIGGHKLTTITSTIENSKSPILLNAISGKFIVIKDKKGRIFIDRPASEGELLGYFLRNCTLPADHDPTVAKSTMNFFELEGMEEHIKGFSPIKIAPTRGYWLCPECTKDVKLRALDSTVEHLLDEHKAEIIATIPGQFFKVHYKMPLVANR